MTHKIFRAPRRCRTVLSLGAVLALSACAMGPDFKTPPAPPVADAQHPYTAAALPAQTASAPDPAGLAQRFDGTRQIPADWWQVFHSTAIDTLVRDALADSPTLAAAQATLRQAQAAYEADTGQREWPQVNLQAGGERQRVALGSAGGVPTGTTYNVFNASVNVSYNVDAFGGQRREIEGRAAQVDYQREELRAARLSLSANVVATAVQEAALRAQLEATREVLASLDRSLDVTRRQAELGAVARQAVLQQQALVAQTRAQLPALEKQLAQTHQTLAVLVGRPPSDAALPQLDLGGLALPADLPLSVPSDLLRQRPDVRASLAQLHQASAQIGVATAALYPQISLSGAIDRQSLTLGKLFSSGTTGWNLIGGIAQPLFNGGALRANRRAAVAAYDAANAQYQQTVLNALLSVANTLRAIDADAETLRTQAEAAQVARESLDLVERQHQLGAVGVLALLDAQRTWLQTQVALTQARAARFADTAALYQALGGGWWNTPDTVAATDAPAR